MFITKEKLVPVLGILELNEPNMTRKVAVNMHMTLDGYGEFPKYPGSDVQSDEPGEGFTDFWINWYDSVDMIVFGRRSFEGHLAYHSEATRNPSDPRYLFEFSRFLDHSQKIVISHFQKKTGWLKNGELLLHHETVR